MPRTMIGLVWRPPVSPESYVHASSSRPTFARSICASVETPRHSTQKPQNSQNHAGSGFPPSLRFRLRAKRYGVATTKLEERSRVGEARRSAKRGDGSRMGRNLPKGGRHGRFFHRPTRPGVRKPWEQAEASVRRKNALEAPKSATAHGAAACHLSC